jgi:hypothetical protein
MSDKGTLLKEADQTFGELRESIDGLTEEQMRQVWLGSWGVREILIHISGWHDHMAAALDRIAKGDAPYPPGTYDDFDAWNARFVEDKAGVKSADAVAELERSHRRLLEAAAAVPASQFGPDGPARGAFDGAGPGHYREHTEQIRQWRRR